MASIRFRLWLPVLLAWAAGLPIAGQAANLNIPVSHPRIWYGAEPGTPGAARLARARSYYSGNPFRVEHWRESTQAQNRAHRGLLTNQASDCTQAIQWMRGYDFPHANSTRWDAESALLIFDWCYQHMSAADRTDVINRWNADIARWNAYDWGGLTQPANNFYWGYLRNSLMWGIISYHDNPQAQSFIDHALDVRYRRLSGTASGNQSVFQQWYQQYGVGGVALEGSEYGIAMLGYPLLVFATAKDYGYDAWTAVPFWRDAVYYLAYALTPAPTQLRDGAPSRYEIFPFNDDEHFNGGGNDVYAEEYANFMWSIILHDPGAAVARQARDWLAKSGYRPSWIMLPEVNNFNVPGTTPTLPVDYYAAGAQFLYGRSANTNDATTFMLQLGGAESNASGGLGHNHLDLGNFQIWRKGRWITRETTGYDISGNGIRSWNNGPVIDPREAVAHNTVLFEGRGQVEPRRAQAKVLRLHSAPGYSYSAVDMTESYRSPSHEVWHARYDWPYAMVAIREFVYLRKLEALVILDRLESGDDSFKPVYVENNAPKRRGTEVRKTFVLHAAGTGQDGRGNPFTLGTATATAAVGSAQRLDLRTLVPATPQYRIVDEENPRNGLFRLEYDVSGALVHYFLNVVSARDTNDAQIQATLSDQSDRWRVTLTHPSKGTATLVFMKGTRSNGGTISIDQGPEEALRSDVQEMLITPEAGPVWQGTSPPPTGSPRVTGGRAPAREASGAVAAAAPVSGTRSPAATAQGQGIAEGVRSLFRFLDPVPVKRLKSASSAKRHAKPFRKRGAGQPPL